MNRFRNFMVGRYGTDQLGVALLVISVLISVIGSIADAEICVLISYIPLGLGVFRMFSKNIHVRANENSKFLIRYTPIEKAVKNKTQVLFGTKTHKYYKCSGCGQMIRVPRGRGKVEIACPKCNNRFITKT